MDIDGLNFDDSGWAGLNGGYRQPYDPRPILPYYLAVAVLLDTVFQCDKGPLVDVSKGNCLV